jgi:hypothetical protein
MDGRMDGWYYGYCVSIIQYTRSYVLTCCSSCSPSLVVVRDNVGPVHLELSRCHCTFFVYPSNRCDSCQYETGDIRNSASHARIFHTAAKITKLGCKTHFHDLNSNPTPAGCVIWSICYQTEYRKLGRNLRIIACEYFGFRGILHRFNW